MLDELADAVDDEDKAKFSIVTFSTSASLLLEAIPSGSAQEALDAARAEIAGTEGENFVEALKVAGSIINGDDVTHMVLLTDGGFLVTDEARLKVAELAEDGGTRISAAQLSRTSGIDASSAPELRSVLLSGVATPGRGVTLFLDESRSIDFDRWFNRLAGGEEVFGLDLPPGLTLDPADMKTGGDLPIVNGRMSLRLSVTVLDDLCALGTQVSGGAVGISFGTNDPTWRSLGSPSGNGLEFTDDDGSNDRALAEERLRGLLDGEVDCVTLDEAPTGTCLDSTTQACAAAAAINRVIQDACNGVEAF